MKALSRRELLLCGSTRAATTGHEEQRADSEVIVGRVRDFPPVGKKILPSSRLEVDSMPEGVRVRSCDNAGQYFSVSMNARGELVVNRSIHWTAGDVYSVLTNGPIQLHREMDV